MKQTFYISGMTCASCEATVKSKLESLPTVTVISVDRKQSKAIIEASQTVSTSDLETLLADSKFNLINKRTANVKTIRDWAKKYKPLLFAYSVVIIATIFLPSLLWNEYSIHTVMSSFMGSFFIYFGLKKFPTWSSFIRSFPEYDHISRWLPGFVVIVPILEVLIGLWFFYDSTLISLNAFVAIWMSMRTWSVIKKLQTGERPVCACLGGENGVHISSFTIIEDASMAMMAIYMLGATLGH